MKRQFKAFTLIELVVSITVFTIILGTAFAQFPYIMGTIVKVNNEKVLLSESIKLKEEFNIKNTTVVFYNYEDLYSLSPTAYDFENRYRKNLKDLINNFMVKGYGITNYQLNNPNPCKLPYKDTQLFTDLDKSIIEEEFELKECYNNINDLNFKNKYKILSIIDTKNLIANIYFSYNGKLNKITTNLITDLDNDDIIFTDFNSNKITYKIYNGFNINKFTGNSFNYCSLDNSNSTECSFTDFNNKQNKQGNLELSMYKITQNGNEINIKSSYILKLLYSINY